MLMDRTGGCRRVHISAHVQHALVRRVLVLAAASSGGPRWGGGAAEAQVAGTISKSADGLSGLKVFGAGIPYGGSDGRGSYDKVWDGDTSTFFDCEKDCGDTGVDLAVTTAVSALRFYPRGDCYRCCADPKDTKGACRMVGGTFDGSTAGPDGPWATIHTVTEKPEEEAWTTVHIPVAEQRPVRWFRYTGNGQKNCNVAEVEVFGVGMSTPGGLGGELATLLLLGGGAYLAAGAALNWRKGRRGAALIPNRAFWTEVRGLAADGVAYVASGGGRRSQLPREDLLGSGRRATAGSSSGPAHGRGGRGSGTRSAQGLGKGVGKEKAKKEKKEKKAKAPKTSTEGGSANQPARQSLPASSAPPPPPPPPPPPAERQWTPTPRSHLASGARETGVKVTF